MICDLLEDADSEWVKDTLDWWNMWVFFMIPYRLIQKIPIDFWVLAL